MRRRLKCLLLCKPELRLNLYRNGLRLVHSFLSENFLIEALKMLITKDAVVFVDGKRKPYFQKTILMNHVAPMLPTKIYILDEDDPAAERVRPNAAQSASTETNHEPNSELSTGSSGSRAAGAKLLDGNSNLHEEINSVFTSLAYTDSAAVFGPIINLDTDGLDWPCSLQFVSLSSSCAHPYPFFADKNVPRGEVDESNELPLGAEPLAGRPRPGDPHAHLHWTHPQWVLRTPSSCVIWPWGKFICCATPRPPRWSFRLRRDTDHRHSNPSQQKTPWPAIPQLVSGTALSAPSHSG
ncbi:hypothetical protein B0H10DRAFT_1941192 [Mycena sp. CBHHK59/15]|nr:hypothetical protein B0H10DRAFT_1941192 [Mycena sp. CBHHK59/15]